MAEYTGTARVKRGMAEMLKGGVIMDVVNAEQAKIAEDAGAVAVMALERVPADIRAQGGVARMSDPDMIEEIKACVSIPVMAKARIGHFVEAQILQAIGVDYIDESEVLTPADYTHHIDKWNFTVPFVCAGASCDVSTNNFLLWKMLLYFCNCFQHSAMMTMSSINNNDIYANANQRFSSFKTIIANSYRGADSQVSAFD